MTTAQLLPEVVTGEDALPHQVHAEEHDQDYFLPASMDLNLCSSQSESAQEPNFEAYVAALQLQDCDDCQPNMEDFSVCNLCKNAPYVSK